MDDTDIDDILSEIKSTQADIKEAQSILPQLSGNNMEDYILKASADVINQGLEALNEMQREVIATRDPAVVESYGNLVNSITKSIDTVSKIHLQQMKNSNSKEIKQMDIDSKERISANQIDAGGNSGQITGTSQTNILVTTREDFMKLVTESESTSIEVDQNEYSDNLPFE